MEAGIDDVKVTRANDGPVAVDDTATVAENTTATIAVLANDSDPNGDPLSVTATTQGAHGAVTLVSGVVRYTPAANYFGPDSFTYTIRDGNGVPDTGTVTVTVTPVNDAPVAVNDTATMAEDSAGISGNVLANDTDVDAGHDADGHARSESGERDRDAGRERQLHLHAGRELQRDRQLHLHGERRHGGLERRDGDDHGHRRQRRAGGGQRHGDDDGRDRGQRQRARQRHGCRAGTTLTATLGASPANGTVTLAADGSFTYTPNANFNGTDSFTYTASDGTAVSNVATVTITVTGVNDAPVAVERRGDDDRRHARSAAACSPTTPTSTPARR